MKARLLAALAPVALLLASPAAASAIQVNQSFKPQNEFKLDPWIPIKLGGIDFSINKGVLYVFLAAAATVIAMVYVARRMEARPNRVQTAVELAYTFTRDTLTRENMDTRMARRWFVFIATLFLFILFCNLLGYIPLPTNTEHKVTIFGAHIPTFAIYAATANISIPLVLTLVVWFAYHVEGIRAKGPIGYFRSWMPDTAGIPKVIIPLVAGIEVISQLVRIISLSVRLFANILAGHLLILLMGGGLAVLLGTAVTMGVVVGIITLPVAVIFYLFEVVLIAGLQAFIFAILAGIYLGGATAEAH